MMMKKSKLRRAMVWLWVIVIVAGGLLVWKMAPSINSSLNSGGTGTEAVGQNGGASGKSLQGSTLPTGGPKGNPQATSDVQ